MKILIIGTGAEIPPTGWGAVESIIWEHLQRIPKFGAEVKMINTNNWFDINYAANEASKQVGPFDFVHFHLDTMFPFARALSMSFPVAMSSHFPYIFNKEMYSAFGWDKVMNYLVDNTHDNYNFCLSEKGKQYYKDNGAKENKLFLLKNGATEDIELRDPKLSDRSIYLGKIARRKGQERVERLLKQSFNQDTKIDYVGPLNQEDSLANIGNLGNNYLGEWTRDKITSSLTDYANLVLLSDGETTTPLVVREALIAGLGAVITETSADELDTSLPFITVVPDDKLNDPDYVRNAIETNKSTSLSMRDDIRAYGIDNFGWDNCVKNYITEIERALDNR